MNCRSELISGFGSNLINLHCIPVKGIQCGKPRFSNTQIWAIGNAQNC
jgi:hypothetical protein